MKKSRRTHWISLIIDRNTAMYFDSFEIEYIPQEVLNKMKDKSITHNMFRVNSDESAVCQLYCIVFIEYVVVTLLDYTNLFSSNNFKRMIR